MSALARRSAVAAGQSLQRSEEAEYASEARAVVRQPDDVEPFGQRRAVGLHHGMARFAWHVVQADGTALPEGLDVVWLSDDGARLARILGFFGPLRRPAGGA